MALNNKDSANKEVLKQQKMNQKELEQVRLSLLDYESDFKYIKQEKTIVSSEMKNFKYSHEWLIHKINYKNLFIFYIRMIGDVTI